MNFKTRLSVILWLAGMAGVLSFLLVDLSKLLATLPLPAATQLPSSIWALKLLGLIQPTILLSFAVFVGVALASKVGLSAPVAEAAAANRQLSSAFKPQIVPGLIGGIAGGGTGERITRSLNFFFAFKVLHKRRAQSTQSLDCLLPEQSKRTSLT